MKYQKDVGTIKFLENVNASFITRNPTKLDTIWYYNNENSKVIDPGPGPYLPVRQRCPIFGKGLRGNRNLVRLNMTVQPMTSIETQRILISELVMAPPGNLNSEDANSAVFSFLLSAAKQEIVNYGGDPMSLISLPIFDSFEQDRQTVAVMVAWIKWTTYFESVLPETVRGIVAVLSDSCGGFYTIQIDGAHVSLLGQGDLHDPTFNDKNWTSSFHKDQKVHDGTIFGVLLDQRVCNIALDVYPSQAFYDSYDANTPTVITLSVAFIFVFTALVFLVYDHLVERRQAIVLQKAIQSTAIVSSLFPENVRDRLMNANNEGIIDNAPLSTQSNRLKGYLGEVGEDDQHNDPIADFFPNCTVLFADIAGFTAWSSTRDPAQVFILLQTLYQEFDVIAKRRKVFKVETIGDCYVAVTGLPNPQPNHAVIMAR